MRRILYAAKSRWRRRRCVAKCAVSVWALAFWPERHLAANIAVIFLMTTIALAIANLAGWPVWTGFGIVTVLVAIAAGAFGAIGKKRLTAARHMPRTRDTLKENIEWMRTRTS